MRTLWACFLLTLFSASLARGQDSLEDRKLPPQAPSFRISNPGMVMTGVPVKKITIEALTDDGQVDVTFEQSAMIEGIVLKKNEREVALPPFVKGVLSLDTNFAAQQKVFIDTKLISVHKRKHPQRTTTHAIRRLPGIFSLFPALMAIGIAIWLRNVIVALFAGVWIGAILLARGNFFVGSIRCLDQYLLEQLTQPDDPANSHLLIVLFTMFLGAMIGVMSSSGGTPALVASLATRTNTRQRGQFMTWMLGMVVFFDDYANSLLVGTTMRPVADRLRISREKLAFLVDSTAAPIAGLALISTWVGFEVGQIQDTYEALGLESEGVYKAFLYSIPYRFYPIHVVLFVGLIALVGNDFGPMLKAEAHAIAFGNGQSPSDGLSTTEEFVQKTTGRNAIYNALIPLASLLVMVIIGLWWTGNEAFALKNAARVAENQAPLELTTWRVISFADSNRVLFFASFSASLIAVIFAVATKTLSAQGAIDAWLNGAKSMFLATVILIMAWAIAQMCDDQHLNTAGFLVELTQQSIAVEWVPSVVFLLAAVIALSTGSSFTTMGLLMPLAITITYSKLALLNEASPHHHLMIASIGAVLAGAIFGDHCSPISDTTVLSSAATGCDHLAHVTTQIPYALTVAAVSLLLGYVPIGLGYHFLPALLPMGGVVLFLIVQFYGRSPEVEAKSLLSAFTETKTLEAAALAEEEDDDFAPPPDLGNAEDSD